MGSNDYRKTRSNGDRSVSEDSISINSNNISTADSSSIRSNIVIRSDSICSSGYNSNTSSSEDISRSYTIISGRKWKEEGSEIP